MKYLLLLLAVAFLTGCPTLGDKKEKVEPPPGPKIADQSGDVAFQSFMGILRQAVAKRDMQTIATMMTPNFGYRIEPVGEGDGVFQYWDENNIWPELELVLSEKFVPHGPYMVAPAEFTTTADYSGYRAGMVRVVGRWKFAYFVRD